MTFRSFVHVALPARFKVHLCNSSAIPFADGRDIKLLANRTIVEVIGDFLEYLYQCTRSYIEDTHSGGTELWKSLEGRTEFILTHPNGWEAAEQMRMRRAAIYAGLVPNTPEGHARVRFVTEGEASLHYCIRNNHALDAIKVKHRIAFLDRVSSDVQFQS